MVTIDNIEEVVQHLIESFNPVNITLFGSVAKQGMGEVLDLLIVVDDSDTDVRALDMQVRRHLSPFFQRFSVDPFIIPLSRLQECYRKGSLFLYLIQREGRSLHMGDSASRWIEQAREDRAMAEFLLEGGYYRGGGHASTPSKRGGGECHLSGQHLEGAMPCRRRAASSE